MSNPWASTYDELRAPYLLEKKAKKDYDGDGKVETGSKEHAGVVHNAIQRAKGGKPDGKDTRKEETVIEGSMKQARKNVGASTCWKGYKAKGTKMKNGRPVPNCVKEDETLDHIDGRKTQIVDVVTAPKMVASPRFSNWKEEMHWAVEAAKGKKLDVQETGVKNKVEINPSIPTEEVQYEHHQKDADGNPIEHGDGTPSNVDEGAPYTVTNADKVGNTPAYQGLMKGMKTTKGKPFYTAAPHLNKAHYEPEGEIIVDESMKQARKNVGASTCWQGYKAKGTKMKNGRKVPNCVKEDEQIDEKMGLYANIHAKRKRGGKMRSKGDKGAPTEQDFKDAAKTAKEELNWIAEKKKGLWDNIHAKRKRGERPARPGEKDYPKTLNVEEKKKLSNTAPLSTRVHNWSKQVASEGVMVAKKKIKDKGVDSPKTLENIRKVYVGASYDPQGEVVQEMPTDIQNAIKGGLGSARDQFLDKGSVNVKKTIKDTLKNVVQTKSVSDFLNKEEKETPKNVKKIAKELDGAVKMHKSQAKRLRAAGVSENFVKDLFNKAKNKINQNAELRKKGNLINGKDPNFLKLSPDAQRRFSDAMKNSYEPEGNQINELLGGKPGDGYLGSPKIGIPNPIRMAKDAVDSYNRSNQRKVNKINKISPGSATMPKFKEFNPQTSDAYKRYMGNSYEPEGEMIEAKVDKKLPEYKRATARDKRYGNPHGSHELGGGIRKDRRADHEKRRGMKEDWQKKSGKSPSGGLNEKGRKSYERQNPGSDLKAPTKKVGNPRRASFCARMKGMKKKLTSKKTASDPDSRINKSLRKWNCEFEPTMPMVEATRLKKEMGYDKGGTKKPTTPKKKDKALDMVLSGIRKKHGKGAIMSGGSKQQKKVKGQKDTRGTGKYKKMADSKNQLKKDAKEMGYGSDTKGYIETKARYGSKENMKKGKGLGT